MKNLRPLFPCIALTLSTTLLSSCALFQSECKCDKEYALKYICPAQAAEHFPSTAVDEQGNPTDLSAVAATHGGDVEPSSALETDENVVAVDDLSNDNDDLDGEDTIDDDFDPDDKSEFPAGITASQMDQILPSKTMRQRLNIPDAARTSVQIPVLTSLQPTDPNWAPEILQSDRDLANKVDSSEPTNFRALVATLLPRSSRKSTAIVTPGNQIEIYTPGRRTMKRPISLDYRSSLLSSLWPHPMYAAQLVEDDPLEVVVIGIDKEGETDAVVMQIFKVFGEHIGRIFSTEIGLLSDKKIVKTAQIEFLSGKDDIGIRRTPIDSKGTPDPSNAVVYDWNHWEGAYRENTPPERSLGAPSWIDQPPVEQDQVAP